MNFRSRFVYFLFPALLLLSACHRTPDHAKYIPKDALMVAEINTKELSKKIAWSMITGSNLWDKIKGSKSKEDSAKQSEFIKNMQEAGIVFVREPVVEAYGTVAVFKDLYGNLWDLIEPCK